ncbi:MAG: disulfide bond formation protein B [Albidovulum sp.]
MMDRRLLILLAAGGSAALLAGAHVFEALGYAPCKLCLWQRGPHWAAVAIGFAALLFAWRPLPWAGALAAAATAVLGAYHTGVERGWWPGPDSCTSTGDLTGSAEDLLDAIMAAPLIRCDEVAWRLIGLSMASWNAILSLALMFLWIAAARLRR